MDNMVALIPLRGGSKSIPLKNIKEIGGQPLVYWVVFAAQQCPAIDKIYIATDSQQIAEVVQGFGFSKVRVIGRGEHTCTDVASTESVMMEFAEQYKFEHIMLIQATSPLLTVEDLSRGIEAYYLPGTDSVLSAVHQKRFIWREKDGYGYADNYDVFNRPRRQEFSGYFVENGAFYITSRNSLLETESRLSGKIRICPMPEESYYELDEQSDWEIVEQLMRNRR